MLARIDFGLRVCQAVVLAPTHELATQMQKVARALGDHRDIKCHGCIGGTPMCEGIAGSRQWSRGIYSYGFEALSTIYQRGSGSSVC